MKLLNILIVVSLIWNSHPVFAQNLSDDTVFFDNPQADTLTRNDIGKMYHFVIDGRDYAVKFVRIAPYPANANGEIRLFEAQKDLGPIDAGVSKDKIHMQPYEGETVDEGNMDSSSGGYGFKDGVADGVGLGLKIYGAGSAYTTGYSISTSIATQLRDGFIRNLEANRKYADNLGKSAAKARAAGAVYDAATSSLAGSILGTVDTEIAETPEIQRRIEERLKPAKCEVSGGSGGFVNMPNDFQMAYLEGDLGRVSEYVELLNDPQALSSFCKGQLKSLTNGNGILSLKKIVPSLKPSPLENSNFKTYPTTSEGAMVRHLANQYQVEWSRSSGLSVATPHQTEAYTAGLALLRSADNRLALGEYDLGKAHAQASEILLNVAAGLTDGFVEAGKELVELAPALADGIKNFVLEGVENPESILTKSHNLFEAVPEIVDGIKQGLIKDYKTILHGSAYERSVLVGRVGMDAAIGFVTGGTVKVVSKVGETAGDVGKILRSRMGDTRYDHYLRGRALEKTANLNLDLIGEKAKVLESVNSSMVDKGITLSDNANDYLANQILHEEIIYGKQSLTSAKLDQLAKQYHRMESVFPMIDKSVYQGPAFRGIAKELALKNGTILYPTADDVMSFTYHGYAGSSRFASIGESQLYLTIASDLDAAIPTIVKETGLNVNELVFDSVNINKSGLLDVSGSELGLRNLDKLSLNLKALTHNNYEVTQMLADLARKEGFTGILYQSAKSELTNIVVY